MLYTFCVEFNFVSSPGLVSRGRHVLIITITITIIMITITILLLLLLLLLVIILIIAIIIISIMLLMIMIMMMPIMLMLTILMLITIIIMITTTMTITYYINNINNDTYAHDSNDDNAAVLGLHCRTPVLLLLGSWTQKTCVYIHIYIYT